MVVVNVETVKPNKWFWVAMTSGQKILISGNNLGEIEAVIIDKNPKTAQAVLEALPFEGIANAWGEEIYFNIPVNVEEENSQEEMDIGDVAFWPMGNAMCVFFGPTPVSESEKPKAYGPVNLFAKVMGDAKVFRKVREGDTVKVKRAGSVP